MPLRPSIQGLLLCVIEIASLEKVLSEREHERNRKKECGGRAANGGRTDTLRDFTEISGDLI